MKRITVLGADGYYGRPLVDRLQNNHYVQGLDNFWRRGLTYAPSLIPQSDPNDIRFCDVTEYDQLFGHLSEHQPDFVVHLAEQRSAPFSMRDIASKHYTIQNNTTATLNVLEAARELGFHVIHIGSMGVYGYDKHGEIAEGDAHRAPGSIYHVSKCMDNQLFEFYSRMYGVAVTELHQGVIWGVGGRFDYDATFGTVVNRFIVQDLLGVELSLYGAGNQQRAFINIENSLDCIELIVNNPRRGFTTYNQYTEIHRLSEIANMISPRQVHLNNPRIENENNTLESTNDGLISMGLTPIHMNADSLDRLRQSVKPYLENVQLSLLEPKIKW